MEEFPSNSMRATVSRLAKMTASYSLVSLMGPVFTILLTPLYTRALSPADYGVLDVAGSFASFVGVFAVLGIDQALNAHFFDGDELYQRNLVTTAVVCVTVCGLLVAAFYLLAGSWLAQTFFKDAGRVYMFYLFGIGSVSGAIFAVIGTALRLRMGVKRVNALGVTSLLSSVTLNVVMVLVLRLKATGIVAANAIASVITCGAGLVLAYRPLSGRFSPRLVRPLVSTGLILVPGVVSALMLAVADRLILVWYVSQQDLGLYSIANKLASMVLVLLGAMWTAWQAMALEMAHQSDAAQQYARVLEYIAAASMLTSLAVGLFAPEILMFFTRDVYVPAAPYALALTAYYGPLNYLTASLIIPLFVRKRTQIISGITFVSAVVNIGLNLLLDPWLGVWGAVLATVLAGAVTLGCAYMAGQRAMRVPYRVGRVLTLGGLYVALMLVVLFIPAPSPLLFRIGALLTFGLAILAIGLVTRGEIALVLRSAYYRLGRVIQMGRQARP